MSDWLHPYDEGYPHEEVMSAEPMTEARSVLLAYANGYHHAECAGNVHIDGDCSCDLARWVLAIEREAAALLRQRVEGLPDVKCHRWHEHTDKAPENVGISRAAVLALFDAAPDAPGEPKPTAIQRYPGDVYLDAARLSTSVNFAEHALASAKNHPLRLVEIADLTFRDVILDPLRTAAALATPPAVAEDVTT